MRAIVVTLTLLGAAAAATSACALNPQPLPPGLHARQVHRFEPPDPCRRFLHRRIALARCRAEHPRR
jgi:hypothetical protein